MHFNRDSFIFTRILPPPPPVRFTYLFVPLRIVCKNQQKPWALFFFGHFFSRQHCPISTFETRPFSRTWVHVFFPPSLSRIIRVFARANKHRRCASSVGDLLAHLYGKQWGDSGNSVGQPREGRRNGICGGWVLKCWIPLSKLKPITTKHSLVPNIPEEYGTTHFALCQWSKYFTEGNGHDFLAVGLVRWTLDLSG